MLILPHSARATVGGQPFKDQYAAAVRTREGFARIAA